MTTDFNYCSTQFRDDDDERREGDNALRGGRLFVIFSELNKTRGAVF